MDGQRLMLARKKKNLSRTALAELLNTTRTTVYRWEANQNDPDDDIKKKLADVLGVSVSFLMGEDQGMGAAHSSMQDAILLPVLSAEITACCGDGIPLLDITSRATRFVPFPKSWIRVFDDLRPPFVIDADGDSMAGYGIPDQSLVAVNPAEDLRSGHIAVVCIGDQTVIKKIYFRPTGIELKSADGRPSVLITPEEQECGWFKIMGKVLGALSGVDEEP
jgi:repressor LexA